MPCRGQCVDCLVCVIFLPLFICFQEATAGVKNLEEETRSAVVGRSQGAQLHAIPEVCVCVCVLRPACPAALTS